MVSGLFGLSCKDFHLPGSVNSSITTAGHLCIILPKMASCCVLKESIHTTRGQPHFKEPANEQARLHTQSTPHRSILSFYLLSPSLPTLPCFIFFCRRTKADLACCWIFNLFRAGIRRETAYLPLFAVEPQPTLPHLPPLPPLLCYEIPTRRTEAGTWRNVEPSSCFVKVQQSPAVFYSLDRLGNSVTV